MRGRAGVASVVVVAGALCACGSSDAPNAVSTLPPTVPVTAASTTVATPVATTAPAASSTGSAPATIVVDTTAPPGAPPPTTQPTPATFDTGTVPELAESADVVTLEFDHDGTTVTARFGSSTEGWALVKLFAGGEPIAGAGAMDVAVLEEAGAIAMLDDGTVVIALVGGPGQPTDGVVMYAGVNDDDPNASVVESMVTGTWSAFDNRLVLLAVTPAGTGRIDVDGLTPNTGIIYEIPTDASVYFPPEANQAPQ